MKIGGGLLFGPPSLWDMPNAAWGTEDMTGRRLMWPIDKLQQQELSVIGVQSSRQEELDTAAEYLCIQGGPKN